MLLAAANDDGCRFGHHCCRRTSPNSIKHKVNKNILISTFIYWFYQNPSTAALERTCARLPTTQTVWIHRTQVAGGVSGSITMVVVFVGCLCCCGRTHDITSSSYVKFGIKITLRWGQQHYFLLHLGVHHTNKLLMNHWVFLWIIEFLLKNICIPMWPLQDLHDSLSVWWIQANRGCTTEAVLCHGQGIFCIVWYISLYLDRLLVILTEGELLWGDSSITITGFDLIPPQALKNLSTPCCSHVGYVLHRYIGRYVSTRDQRGNWICFQWKSTYVGINWHGCPLKASINDSINGLRH